MSDARDILRIADEWLSEGESICIATVIKRKGSAPREVGAKMVISSSGRLAGTIGGGAVENEIVEKAPRVIKDGRPVILDFDLSGQSSDSDSICGGKTSVFLEPFGQAKGLFIIGAGHVGLALANQARRVGFRVTLVDDREEYLGQDRLGSETEAVTSTPDEADTKLKIDESSFVVICARSHNLDKEWVARLAVRSPRYIGMLGSKHKGRVIFEELEAGGIPRENLAKVRTPVGIDIGAMTPEEIAVSISAELIREWHEDR